MVWLYGEKECSLTQSKANHFYGSIRRDWIRD